MRVVALAGVCLWAGSVQAAILDVGTTGATYTSVQSAVTAAASGDTIRVAPGIYSENLNYRGKRLIIESTGGRAVTTLRPATTNEPLVRLSSAETGAVLDGFRLTGGAQSALSVAGAELTMRNCEFNGVSGVYGVYLTAGARVLMERVDMLNGQPGYAVAMQGGTLRWTQGNVRGVRPGNQLVSVQSGTLTVVGARFEDNRIAGGLGGVLNMSGGSAVLDGVTLERNSATYGGGIYVSGSAQLTLVASRLAFNSASQGGALHAGTTSRVFIRDTWFIENSADIGGAIHATGTTLVSLNNALLGNTGNTQGSAVNVGSDSDVLVLDTVVAQNAGPTAVSVSEGARVQAWYNVVPDAPPGAPFDAEHANLRVAPAYVAYSPDGEADNDTLVPAAGSPLRNAGLPGARDADGTRADVGPGGLNDAWREPSGRHVSAELGDDLSGVVAVSQSGDTIWVYPGIYRTTVNPAGRRLAIRGIYGAASVVVAGTGTAVQVNSGESDFSLSGLTLWASPTQDGYGLFLQNTTVSLADIHLRQMRGPSVTAVFQGNANVTARDVVVEDNDTGTGWLVSGSSSLELDGARFARNDTGNGPGVLRLDTAGAVTVRAATFEGNRAGTGGALHADGTGPLRVADAQFSGNVATNGGAVHVEPMRTVVMEWVLLSGNAANVNGGALHVRGTALTSNVVLMGNRAGNNGGAAWVDTAGSLRVAQGVVAENDAPRGAAIHSEGYSELRNTAVIHHQMSQSGAALQLGMQGSAAAGYCNFHDNFRDRTPGNLEATNINVAPGFVSYTVNTLLEDDLHLTAQSAMKNQGDPSVLDADATRSDIGLYGGPSNPDEDRDMDGWSVRRMDCDDRDPTRNPGMVELCNGRDDNCDGQDDPRNDMGVLLCTLDAGPPPPVDAGNPTSADAGAPADAGSASTLSSGPQPSSGAISSSQGDASSAAASSSSAAASTASNASSVGPSSNASFVQVVSSGADSRSSSSSRGSSAGASAVSSGTSSANPPDDGGDPGNGCAHSALGTGGVPSSSLALMVLALRGRRRRTGARG